MTEGRLWRIVGRTDRGMDFVAGLIVRDGLVVQAAPILGWSSGMNWPIVKYRMQAMKYHGEAL